MSKEIILDASELEAPLPLKYAVRSARNLQAGSYIKMIHRMKPCHLFDFLKNMNVWSYDFEDGEERHLIFMAKDKEDIDFVKELLKNEYGRIVA